MGILSKLKETKAFLDGLEGIDEQPLSEVVLEEVGVNIPLPTEEQAKDFYTEIGEPNNALTKTLPQDWTRVQYLEYQSDVRRFQAKNKFKGIKDATKLKRKKNEEKQKKERKKFKQDFLVTLNKDIQDNLEENRPEDSKLTGIQKLGQSASNITKVLAKTCLPTLLNMVEQVGLDTFETKKQEALTELGIQETLDDLQNLTDPTQVEELKTKLCPTPETLDSIIQQRNGIVNFLNNQQTKVNSLRKLADGTGDVADFLQNTALAITLSTFIANQAAKIIPLIPGAVVSAINDLNTVKETIVFKQDGSARIPPLRGAVSNFSTPLNQVNIMITKIVQSLSGFDEIIAFCSPNATLESLSPDVLSTVAVQLSASETETGSLYKGFRLEIEEKPFSDTVTQNRAVGKNASGIVLIATEYSFASNPNVLINELKFIIDRDNLKAY